MTLSLDGGGELCYETENVSRFRRRYLCVGVDVGGGECRLGGIVELRRYTENRSCVAGRYLAVGNGIALNYDRVFNVVEREFRAVGDKRVVRKLEFDFCTELCFELSDGEGVRFAGDNGYYVLILVDGNVLIVLFENFKLISRIVRAAYGAYAVYIFVSRCGDLGLRFCNFTAYRAFRAVGEALFGAGCRFALYGFILMTESGIGSEAVRISPHAIQAVASVEPAVVQVAFVPGITAVSSCSQFSGIRSSV